MINRLTGTIQPYPWGSTTSIPEFLGTEPTGGPQAELWLGTHPQGPSRLNDDQGLAEFLAAAPERRIGAEPVARFGPRLPYLMKVLAAARPLSLQAHPSREQAEHGFAREDAAGIARDAPNRTYRDDWPKPEALCALAPVQALCGFREPELTYAMFERLEVPAALELVAPLADGGPEALAEVFGRLLRLPEDRRGVIDDVVSSALDRQGRRLDEFGATAVEVATHYPGDPGVLAALLMNRVSYGPYQAIFLPAGNLHAYLSGTGVEIMANSDNVLRGGLTGKYIDVDELIKLLDFTPGMPGLVPIDEPSPGVFHYRTPAPEFGLWRLEPDGATLPLPAPGTGRVLLAAAGTIMVSAAGADLTLSRGQAAFVPAEIDDAELSGAGVAFVGGPGLSGH
ncbi:mannose-6-phosphate isomerase, class I [Microlunatus speluncae]|uniref:mannose-6-phosphate isomerase, class I n=1 Tax=Microlunatus speluncae TaxID=2594267 RepID=UPI001C2D02A7|nr:mannose-6-phosphate isomerase, class I [Microlunatus speluncae]